MNIFDFFKLRRTQRRQSVNRQPLDEPSSLLVGKIDSSKLLVDALLLDREELSISKAFGAI